MRADDRSIRHCTLPAAVARWPRSGVPPSMSPDVTSEDAQRCKKSVCLGRNVGSSLCPSAWLPGNLSLPLSLSLFSSPVVYLLEHHAVSSMAGRWSPLLRNTRGHERYQGPASTSNTSISNQFRPTSYRYSPLGLAAPPYSAEHQLPARQLSLCCRLSSLSKYFSSCRG